MGVLDSNGIAGSFTFVTQSNTYISDDDVRTVLDSKRVVPQRDAVARSSLAGDGDIACGQIDIGNAETEMTQTIKKGVPQANLSLAPEPVMDVENVASAVLYMDSLALDANVQFMTVMATKMPFIGRG